uniref:Cytochrome P450 family protein n=1 Tax=Wuchereria bancrofti TaxID=6293 RepID=A0A1I8EJE5_WUCBA
MWVLFSTPGAYITIRRYGAAMSNNSDSTGSNHVLGSELVTFIGKKKMRTKDTNLDCTTIRKRNWMAFGAGPRQCVGMRFAMLETKIIICSLLKKFRFRKIENTCKIAYNKPSRMEHRTIID